MSDIKYPRFTIVPDHFYFKLEKEKIYICYHDIDDNPHTIYFCDAPGWFDREPLEEPYPMQTQEKLNHYVISNSEAQLYYIRKQNEFVGNAAVFWGHNSRGYVTDIRLAGKYDKGEAQDICSKSSDSEAIPCYLIDYNDHAVIHNVDPHKLEFDNPNIIKPQL